MTGIAVQQRTWIYPSTSERLTWDEMRSELRSSTGRYSTVSLPDYQLNEVMDREIRRLLPYSYTQELWQTTLTDFPEYIMLPWRPYRVVSVGWQTSDRSDHGCEIDSSCWQIFERQWRWIGPVSGWPTGSVSWYLDAVGRPRTTTEEPVYATVMPELLIPFVGIELDRLETLEAGGLPQEVNQAAMAQRQSAIMMLPKVTAPGVPPRLRVPTVSTVVFRSWDQTDLTFADFVTPEA